MNGLLYSKNFFLYSSLSREIKKIYKNEIYKFLGRLIFEYHGFSKWYSDLFLESAELKSNREIIICENELKIAGIAILKKDKEEKKICTLRVAKEFQHQGIGHQLVEMCMQELCTEKPMITLHQNKLNQFEKLLEYYNFELEQTQKHYYSIFSTELVFNGFLPEKKILFNQIELIDIERIYESFCRSGKINFEEYLEACVRCWYNREQIKERVMIEA